MLRLFSGALCILWLSLSNVSLADEVLRQRIEGWSAGYPALVGERSIANAERLQGFYGENRYEPLWLNDQRLNESAQHLIEIIQNIEVEGLLPTDYHSRYLQPEFASQPQLALSEYDILLTDAFLSLSQHILAGKVDPETLTPEWKVKKRTLNTSALLTRVKGGESVAEILTSLRPKQPRYARSKAALERLRRYVDKTWPPLTLTPMIKQGATDARIPAIRERLVFWGDLAEANDSATFDEQLAAAVKAFQSRHGLEPDGVIGNETLSALNVTIAQRVQDIVVNLERWRWLEEDFGSRFMLVNIAAFDLRIYENDKKVFERPVIVGKNYRKTPVFSDLIRHIVFNPTWTVPHKLAVQDKLPDIKKDPEYLSRMGFTLYNIGTSDVVDPLTVDWHSLKGKRFPFRMVQEPGPMNALGQVKFMFPNPYDVYLHDTPSRDLFKKSERAFSSGCIRVSDPLELAEVLLQSKGWNANRIASVLDSGKTTTVFLDKPMPVHIEYWTAWVDGEDKLHFRKDIYGRDAPLWQALSRTL